MAHGELRNMRSRKIKGREPTFESRRNVEGVILLHLYMRLTTKNATMKNLRTQLNAERRCEYLMKQFDANFLLRKL